MKVTTLYTRAALARYRAKVARMTFGVLIISLLIWAFSSWGWALLVAALGLSGIGVAHSRRCLKCLSWRTRQTQKIVRPDDTREYELRKKGCDACGYEVTLDRTLRRRQ